MKHTFSTFLLVSVVLMLCVSAQEKPSKTAGAKPSSQAAKTGAKKSNGAVPAADKAAQIKEALSAAPPEIVKTAKVLDWDGNVLKDGTGMYTCYPTPAQMSKVGKEPMCLDKASQAWADAWLKHKEPKVEQVGITYMLEGDTGASNIDPYAQGRTSDNQWVVSGPHIMVIVPDSKQLEGLSTDPNSGGPFVMWKGTPYAHIMVPVGKGRSGGSHMGGLHAGGKPKSD